MRFRRSSNWNREHEELEAFMKRMPFRIDPKRLVRKLAAGEKQKLEILKQLYLGSRVIILDEPTSVLTPDEADEVLGLCEANGADGASSACSSSRTSFARYSPSPDHVSILRRGQARRRARRSSTLTPEKMAELMVGAEPPGISSMRGGDVPRGPRARTRSDRRRRRSRLARARQTSSLGVRAGEIVGIAGVSGNGQDELVEVLAGQRPA